MVHWADAVALQGWMAWAAVPLGAQAGRFSLRLACGVCWMLALLSPRQVDSGFFQRRLYLVFGLAVLAALSGRPPGVAGSVVWYIAIAATIASYAGTALWMLQRQQAGRALLWLLAILMTIGVLMSAELPTAAAHPATDMLARIAPLNAAIVMGAVVVAMLLGHAYLTAPGMSLLPLKRLLRLLAAALVLRAVLAACGWALVGLPSQSQASIGWPVLVLVRALAGIVGPLVLVGMTWQTVKIRSTQSATGILYAGVAMVFLGELTAQLLTPTTGMLL